MSNNMAYTVMVGDDLVARFRYLRHASDFVIHYQRPHDMIVRYKSRVIWESALVRDGDPYPAHPDDFFDFLNKQLCKYSKNQQLLSDLTK